MRKFLKNYPCLFLFIIFSFLLVGIIFALVLTKDFALVIPLFIVASIMIILLLLNG